MTTFTAYTSPTAKLATFKSRDIDTALDAFVRNNGDVTDVDCISDHMTACTVVRTGQRIVIAENEYDPTPEDFE